MATTATASPVRFADDVRLRSSAGAETTAEPATPAVPGPVLEKEVIGQTVRNDKPASHVGGVYHSRTVNLPGISVEHRANLVRLGRVRRADPEGAAEEGDHWQDGQLKTKQVFRGRTTLWYVFFQLSSIGMIYRLLLTASTRAGSRTSQLGSSTAILARGLCDPPVLGQP